MPAALYYDPVYTDGLSPEARFPRERYRLLRAELGRRGVDARTPIRPSPPVAIADLLTAHDPAYVEAFLEGRLDEAAARRIGLRPWTDRIVERTLKILGGSVAATRALFEEGLDRAGNLAGGTHHAFGADGAGYCVFNDVAVAARVAQRDHGIQRVLVVDLDVHQGDGTAALFADDPSVFTFSIHCARNFPFRKQRSDLDVALPDDTEDEAYLSALDAHLPRLLDEVSPQLVIYQAGVDPLAEDHLGRMALSRRGLDARNRRVLASTRERAMPLLVLMGGGYARPIERSVEALGDLFEAVAESDEATPPASAPGLPGRPGGR